MEALSGSVGLYCGRMAYLRHRKVGLPNFSVCVNDHGVSP